MEMWIELILDTTSRPNFRSRPGKGVRSSSKAPIGQNLAMLPITGPSIHMSRLERCRSLIMGSHAAWLPVVQ